MTNPTNGEGLSDRRAYLLIALVGLLFFAPLVLHPAHVLYSDHSDFLALHLPTTQFQMRLWRETGELPLWCPYCFSGRPFAHELYPLHLPFFLLPESWVAPGLSWLIVLHVIVAGWGMFAYSRARGLGVAGSLVAAFGMMFPGSLMLHTLIGGHYFIGLAWLPWLLLFLERGLRGGGLTSATLAGVFYGLFVWATHPQLSFYAGLFIALWTLELALESAGFLGADAGERSVSRTARALGRWLGMGTWTALLGIGLTAVQLVPSIVFATASSRAAGISALDLLLLGRQTLFSLVGPSIQAMPESSSAWEERGGLGLIVLGLAVLAPVLRQNARVALQTAVCAILFLFAVGGALALQWLPIVAMLREPARMFLIAAFPVAYLAGVSVDALVREPGPTTETRGISRFVLLVTAVIIGILTVTWAKLLAGDGYALALHPYWISLAITLPLALWLLGGSLPRKPQACAWAALVLIDLAALSWPYLHTRSEPDIYPVSESVRYLAEHRDDFGRVLDEDFDPDGRDLCSPLGRGAPLAVRLNLHAVRGYHPVDVARYKKFLQFLGDVDHPLVVFEDPLTFPVIRDVVIEKEQDLIALELSTIGLAASPQAPAGMLTATALVPGRIHINQSLLNLLGVRYLLCPAERGRLLPGWRQVFLDPEPRAFDVAGTGVCNLVPYAIYENPDVLPRAFVVPNKGPIDPALPNLKNTDLRSMVLLVGTGRTERSWPPRNAVITEYRPNEIRISVEAGGAGYLVLTDPWFEGWTCTVAGKDADVMRGDFAFRTVAVPGEACEAVFRFEPPAFTWGWRITRGTLALVVVLLGAGWIHRRSVRKMPSLAA